MADDKKAEIQQKYLEYQGLGSEIKQIQTQVAMLENQIMELNTFISNLSDMKPVRDGSDILVPLGNGVFAKAQLKKLSELLVNVGAGIVVSKNVDDAKALLEKQKTELLSVREQMTDALRERAVKAADIEKELTKLTSGK